MSNTTKMSGDIRVLSSSEIEEVGGGVDGWVQCPGGIYGEGLLPGDKCPTTWGQLIGDTIQKCNDILQNGGGKPA